MSIPQLRLHFEPLDLITSRRPRAHPSPRLHCLFVFTLLSLSIGCDDEPPVAVSPWGAGQVMDLAGELTGGQDQSGGALAGANGEIIAGVDSIGGDGAGSSTPPYPVAPPAPEGFPRFRFPIYEEDVGLISPSPVFGVDHDPSSQSRILCLDYAGRGFPFCYDDHTGSDYMLQGGFMTMDNGSARVVAAYPGIVSQARDGQYDRCHTDISIADVTCDGHPIRANYITIRHSGGWETSYYHLKRDSLLVDVGDTVNCGDIIGLVGSSGYSSGPHLHFEVTTPRGDIQDPYAGPESQPYTLWVEQRIHSEGDFPSAASSLPSTSCSEP